jgi:hypothetical protein
LGFSLQALGFLGLFKLKIGLEAFKIWAFKTGLNFFKLRKKYYTSLVKSP